MKQFNLSKKYIALLAFFHFITNCTYQTFNLPTDALKIAKRYLPKNPVILEAGAFDGTDSVILSKFWRKGVVHSFEPVPQIYLQLTKKTRNNPRIYTYPFALSDMNGTATFYVSEIANKPGIPSMSSSLLPPKDHLIHAPNVVFNNQITVPTLTIDTWAQEYGINKIDFMWLDMQGYELAALKASPNILKTVKVILTEVEFVEAYEGQYLFNEVKEWLEQQGFEMVARNFYTNWFADALFVRK